LNAGLVAGRATPATIQVYFSPKGGCTGVKWDWLNDQLERIRPFNAYLENLHDAITDIPAAD